MPADSLRLLVLGCGSIGHRHIWNLSRLGVKELWAFDPRPERLNRVVDELKVQPVRSVEEGLEKAPKGVLILTPPALHVPLAHQALEAGAHLFIEKPISHTPEGVPELIELARRRSRTIQVGYHLRFHPGLKLLRQWLNQGRVGKVLWAESEFGQTLVDWRPHQDYRESYTAHQDQGGGILLDASHEIDYLRWFFGELHSVMAHLAHVSPLEMDGEDLAWAWLWFENGLRARLHLDCVQSGYHRQAKVVGTEGKMLWDYREGLRWYRADRRAWETFPVRMEPDAVYQEELKEFLSCMEGKATPTVDGLEALRDLEVVRAARVSNESGLQVPCAVCEPFEPRAQVVIRGPRVTLRTLTPSDVTESYVRWMNDPEVNQLLESRFIPQTKESLVRYVSRIAQDPNFLFLAIMLRESNRHIGNIKLGPINRFHRTSDLGFLIGEKHLWGKGYATEAITLMTEYAFEHLGLRKITAGCYSPNTGSAKALEKAKFVKEGLRPSQLVLNGTVVDELLFGRIRPEIQVTLP